MEHDSDRGIPASCPECGKARMLAEEELGQDIECEGCGSVFHVEREKHWHRLPSSLRSHRELNSQVPVAPDRSTSSNGSRKTIFTLAVLVIIAVVVVLKWDTIMWVLEHWFDIDRKIDPPA